MTDLQFFVQIYPILTCFFRDKNWTKLKQKNILRDAITAEIPNWDPEHENQTEYISAILSARFKNVVLTWTLLKFDCGLRKNENSE